MYRIRQGSERDRDVRAVSLYRIEHVLVSRVSSRECDRRSVRRPNWFRVVANSEPDWISGVDIYDPDPARVAPLTPKRDSLSIGRPIWIVVSRQAVRYSPAVSAIRVGDEQPH